MIVALIRFPTSYPKKGVGGEKVSSRRGMWHPLIDGCLMAVVFLCVVLCSKCEVFDTRSMCYCSLCMHVLVLRSPQQWYQVVCLHFVRCHLMSCHICYVVSEFWRNPAPELFSVLNFVLSIWRVENNCEVNREAVIHLRFLLFSSATSKTTLNQTISSSCVSCLHCYL